MKKFLLAVLVLLSHIPCQATQSSKLQKCLGATTLLLNTLSSIKNVKDKNYTKTALENLKLVRKDLDNRQVAKDLYDAIEKRDYKRARRLLKDKPNLAINAKFGEYKRTVLIACCIKGDESIDVVKDILKHPKFDITIKYKYGATYLHSTCYFGVPQITSLLFERDNISKVLHIKDKDGKTPLDCIVGQIKESRGEIGHVTVWNMMVAKGTQLSYYKDEYEKLNSDDFKSPYSSYVQAIKSNPPKDMKQNDNTLTTPNIIMQSRISQHLKQKEDNNGLDDITTELNTTIDIDSTSFKLGENIETLNSGDSNNKKNKKEDEENNIIYDSEGYDIMGWNRDHSKHSRTGDEYGPSGWNWSGTKYKNIGECKFGPDGWSFDGEEYNQDYDKTTHEGL